MALVKEYFDITNKYQNEYGEKTLLLMQVGAFFEVYGLLDDNHRITGSQISEFTQICDLNFADKNTSVDSKKVLMAGFKDFLLEKYLKKMQDAGYTVVVYVQDEQAKNTTRSLFGIFSPGTFFSNDTNQLTNNITCIWIEKFENKWNTSTSGSYLEIGVGNIDILTGKSNIFQIREQYIHNPTTYDELEKFISIYNPCEVIFLSNLLPEEMNDILQFINVKSRLTHTICLNKGCLEKNDVMLNRAHNCEKQTYQKEILGRFFGASIFDIFLDNYYENILASQSYCFLLDFIFQHNPYLVEKIEKPEIGSKKDRLVLANHSLKQLNIIDDSNYQGKCSSVLKMLNMCCTPMGKRQFNNLFLNPIINPEKLNVEYNCTEYLLKTQEESLQSMRSKLREIKDISKWIRQMYIKKIPPKNFYLLYENLDIVLSLFNCFESDEYISNYLSHELQGLKEYSQDIKMFLIKNLILEKCLTIDQTQQFEDNFFQQGVDSELDEKTQLLEESLHQLESLKNYFNIFLSAYEKKTKTTEYFKIHETEKNNFSLMATKRRCSLLKDKLPKDGGLVTISYISKNDTKSFSIELSFKTIEFQMQGASNQIIFHKKITEICKNIGSVKSQLKETITGVYMKFIDGFKQFIPFLEKIIEFITKVDIMYTKMTIASKYGYCKPVIDSDPNKKSYVVVTGVRHCLIEQLQTSELYVSNDITLGNGQDDGLLLYGTNAVGKTSFIKSLGISVIMAQSGLFVPATSFVYKPYHSLFTRILGNDNIFKGLSTFAVEMSELRTILRLSDENSLILGDELCSGTESISAVSIFVSGIHSLVCKKSSFVFATHLHEIGKYDEIMGLKNVSCKHLSVIYDREKGTLVYDRKLKPGMGTNMYGLEVCKSLQLPDDFLEYANNIRMKYHPESKSILDLNTSHYNSKKIMGLCEKCGSSLGTEVHHLQHQKDADEKGLIRSANSTFHKNNRANLMTLCESCHKLFHSVKK
jgi:DNA mismatch repair protein MutS